MKNKRRIGEIIKLRTGDESYMAYLGEHGTRAQTAVCLP